MKLLLTILLFFTLAFSNEKTSNMPKYTVQDVPKKMSVKTKKARYYYLVEPAVQKVYGELYAQYEQVKNDINASKNLTQIEQLKKSYKADSDEALLKKLKPHPPSITLAQGAMESAWGTSRFFVQANNIFGMWSSNPNQPRIAASEKRGGTRTIWLRKFDSVEQSVRAYYRLMAMGRAYKEFRDVRYESDDVFAMVDKLDKYSEIGEAYPKELRSMIRYNKLTKYDKIVR